MKNLLQLMSFLTIVAGFSGCVVKEYPHHEHHDRVYIEHEPVVEEKVVVR